jgi:hypothetical protein
MYFWVILMPTIDEIPLYHIFFCGYPAIPLPFPSFFSQVRQRQFLPGIGAHLRGNRHQHFSAGPLIEGLCKIAEREAQTKITDGFCQFNYGLAHFADKLLEGVHGPFIFAISLQTIFS